MRVLVAGLGSIGRKHLDAFRAVAPENEYAALRSGHGSEPTPEGVAEAAEAAGFEPDLALVCTPTSLHATTVAALAPTGAAIFVEKPLAHIQPDLDAMTPALAGRPFFHGTVLRHHPLLVRTRALLADGGAGRPLSYSLTCGSWLPDWRPGRDYRTSYSSRADLGGGVALDLIHEFDYATWLFGAAESLTGVRKHVSDLELDVDDLCLATLTHAGGVMGQIGLSYFRPQPRRDFEIVCSDAVVTGNLLDGTLVISRASGEVVEEGHPASTEELMRLQAARVLAAVEAGSGDDLAAAAELTSQVIAIPFER